MKQFKRVIQLSKKKYMFFDEKVKVFQITKIVEFEFY